MAESDLPPIPHKVPLLDKQGNLVPAWAVWFRQLFFRVGGNSAKTNLELDLGSLDSVSTDMIQSAAVTTAKLASQSVSTAKLVDGSVTTVKIADDNVTTAKILDANVTAGKLADDAVTTAKILDANVTTAKIADSNVTTAKIADDNITTAKILDEAVTPAKLNTDDAETGQMLRYNGSEVVWDNVPLSAGTGGELVTDADGHFEISISPSPTTWVIADSGAAKWDVKVGTDGILYTESGSSGDVTDTFKIQKPDLSYGQIGIGTDGALYVEDVPVASTVDNLFHIQSTDLAIWKIAIDDSNRIQTIEDEGDGSRLSIVNSVGDVFWQLRSLPGFIILQYLRVLSVADLAVATPPPTVTDCLPYIFYNNGSVNRLIFYDGSAWRYVHDNSAV